MAFQRAARFTPPRALLAREPGRGLVSRQPTLLAQGQARRRAADLAQDPRGAAAQVRRLQDAGAAPLLIAGDSHSRLYIQRSRRDGRWLLPLHHLATGASARGLANPGSRSGEGARLAALVQRAAEAEFPGPVLLVFGQVDVEFVASFARLRQDPPRPLDAAHFEAFCRATVDAYVGYAAALARTGVQLSVAAIFPPALSDAAWRAGYLNAHIAHEHAELDADTLRARLARAEIADLPTRTRQHAGFNALLREAADRAGVGYLDVAGALPQADGAVSRAMVGRGGGRDHHLDAEAVRPYVADGLWSLFA